jgi:hypothetical protein
MSEPKHSPRGEHDPRDQGGVDPNAASHIRPHPTEDVVVPPQAPPLGAGETALEAQVIDFLDDWALRHFTASVKMHDVARLSEGDGERQAVLEDLAVVQGILLEVHDFVMEDERVRTMIQGSLVLQNGVGALYGWLDDVLEAASQVRVTQNKPGFADTSDEALKAILRMMERLHPDLELLVRVDTFGEHPDIAQKLSLCFRQIGAAVVRVSGRSASSFPGGIP